MSNQKPFDPTKPVQTRDGRKARILATDLKSEQGAIVALVTSMTGENALHFHQGGRYYRGCESAVDLVNVPEKRVYERWVNVYGPRESYEYASPALANADACTGRIACIHIKQEYVEGEGL